MSKMSLWNPRKGKNYEYIDRMVNQMFSRAATSIYVHKYLGIGDGEDPTEIEDPLFQENRDRHYDPHIYELLGTHNVQDMEFSLSQFGMVVESDIIYMELHMNETYRRLGRKIMNGDVIELPHMRDDMLLDPDAPALNKFYVVDDVTRAAGGYSPTWFPHLLRIKLKPFTASDEYVDIILGEAVDGNGDPIIDDDGTPINLGDIISDYNTKMELNQDILDMAEAAVDKRNFETRHFYVVPDDQMNTQYPWIFAGDGHPPNGAIPLGAGHVFPDTAQEGDWYLRTDFEPYVLFRKDGPVWRRQEVDYRKKWEAAHRLLFSFINNNKITNIQGETFSEKQPLSKALKPRADF